MNMTLQEIQTLVAAGYTKADIDAMQQPAEAQPVVQAQPIQVQQPVQAQPAQDQSTVQLNNFLSALENLGKQINQQGQQPAATNAQQPVSVPSVQQVQPAATPSNTGLTSEEATKLFQAWSRGAATQNVELPPVADDILASRFKSLYGVDTSQSKQ